MKYLELQHGIHTNAQQTAYNATYRATQNKGVNLFMIEEDDLLLLILKHPEVKKMFSITESSE